MPRGRLFVPCTENDGKWFQHRKQPCVWPVTRSEDTSTGVMLNDPFLPYTAMYPPRPPVPYREKDAPNFQLSNDFSSHDNKRDLQEYGSHLGNGRNTRVIGKKILSVPARQHGTTLNYLEHKGCENMDLFMTSHVDNFRGIQSEDSTVQRRFPRFYKHGVPGNCPLTTHTANWYSEPDVPYKTPMQVLASSQEPHAAHSKWKYSNRSMARCYPAYDSVNKAKPYPTWMVPGKTRAS